MSTNDSLSTQKAYKVRLTSGRILGPLTIERVAQLISKNQITGLETVRSHPIGEWKDINQFPEIAEFLIKKAEGKLATDQILNAFAKKETTNDYGPTSVLSGALQSTTPLERAELKPIQKNEEGLVNKTQIGESDDDDRTQMYEPSSVLNDSQKNLIEMEGDQEKTSAMKSPFLSPHEVENSLSQSNQNYTESDSRLHNISSERTVVFQRSTENKKLPGKKKLTIKEWIRALVIGVLLGGLGYQYVFDEEDPTAFKHFVPIRPSLPGYIQGKIDPKKSTQLYEEGIKKYYFLDTIQGYKKAAQKLKESAQYDVSNVKALALLASSYINLIDVSNKDEKYFSTLSKLIDMSKAKDSDLPETIIAEVEFYITVNEIEAAQRRIIEYTKRHPDYGLEMFYYIAWISYLRGDSPMAAKYITQIPDNKIYSSRIFYLRGLIAESLNDSEAAVIEYKKAIKFNPSHAKSYLRLVYIMSQTSHLKESSSYLDFLMKHNDLLSPNELALAYYLNALHDELYEKWDLALGSVERAVKLDPDNHDYLLELYTLRAKAGDSLQSVQKQARMYYFLGEGEKLIKQGKYQEALVPLLQARESNDKSPIPLIKIGDMFNNLNNIENAKMNYKLAAEKAPKDILVWSKYIQTLIQGYEWQEAQKAMDKFRKLPVSQSAIDKAAADMYQKQGKYQEAQVLYKKAMARESIDPDVYIAYAKSLMSTNNFKDAPFFFSLALRFDPLNINAILLTAQCIGETESIDKAISTLQDELKQRKGARAEFLSAIAEFQMKKGAWDQAQNNINEAMQVDSSYAYSWKLQAKIYLNQESEDKEALNKALYAFKSYSDRNPSDPSGYLERYKIFVKKLQFDKAKEELTHIYSIVPRYPNLHYYMGVLYSVQGNHAAAAGELKLELENNPNNFQSLIAFGKELMDLGHHEQALQQFTIAMQNSPNSSEAKQEAAWANYHLKNFQAALALMKAAQAIDKMNPLLFKRIGIIYREMGDLQSSCEYFRKYLEIEPDASDRKEYESCL